MATSNSGGNNTETSTAKKLGTLGLAAIVLSSMVGGGIFSLPENMAAGAAAGAVIIAWIITGFGIYFIANSFRILSAAKPNLTAGIYMYSRDGFGNYAGFTIAWGYWLCQIFGNVGYAVITMDALNYFFPGVFAGGNNLWSIVGGSVLIWVFNFTVLGGIKQASSVNTIATICKILPLVIFIIVMLCVFNWDKFTFDFWGHSTDLGEKNLGSLTSQIKSTMLVTLWAFIGIEGAVVLSGRAKSPKDVGKATILGFAGGLVVFVLLSILPFGFMHQSELSAVANPSTAGILQKAVGNWGSVLMNVGLIIAILASWLAWTMITAEIPYAAAKDGTFPKIFSRENSNGSPSVSLWITSILMQLAMLMVYFSNNAWNTMLSITGVMVLPPYLASTAYLWKISADKKLFAENKTLGITAKSALISAVFGSGFALWLIYAAGLKYLLVAIIFIALGIPIYIWARKERNQKVFTFKEGVSALCISAIAVMALVMLSEGKLNLNTSTSDTSTTQSSTSNDIKIIKKQKAKDAPITKRHGENVLIIEEEDLFIQQ
ncbi:MAG: amino acid permease [Opitutales bacterium]|nr:amino acid permease [Opitutales bacterium]